VLAEGLYPRIVSRVDNFDSRPTATADCLPTATDD